MREFRLISEKSSSPIIRPIRGANRGRILQLLLSGSTARATTQSARTSSFCMRSARTDDVLRVLASIPEEKRPFFGATRPASPPFRLQDRHRNTGESCSRTDIQNRYRRFTRSVGERQRTVIRSSAGSPLLRPALPWSDSSAHSSGRAVRSGGKVAPAWVQRDAAHGDNSRSSQLREPLRRGHRGSDKCPARRSRPA